MFKFFQRHKRLMAWTFIEITLAMIVLSVLISISVQIVKPKKFKIVPFAYAGLRNLQQANSYIIHGDGSEDAEHLDGLPETNAPASNPSATNFIDEHCAKLSDLISSMTPYYCQRNANTQPPRGRGAHGKPNFQALNLVAYYGLERAWTTITKGAATTDSPDETMESKMKEILIDINGDEGENEIGKDQFPLRVYIDGTVVPSTCVNSHGFNKNPFCLSGTSQNMKDYAATNFPFSYVVYQGREPTEAEKASGRYPDENDLVTKLLYTNLDYFRADCMTMNNIYTRAQCNAAGIAVDNQCKATDDAFITCLTWQSKPMSLNFFAVPSF